MSVAKYDAVDLFAGPGGWDVAAARLGLRVLGVELDDVACATRGAAGHHTLQADVMGLDPHAFVGVRGVIASPPCPGFSQAGHGDGRTDLSALLSQQATVFAGHQVATQVWADWRSPLTLEPARWIGALRPTWVALEQVPAVLPVWQALAAVLRSQGYSAWAGVLCAEEYGVPQTRQRAVLLASTQQPVRAPAPTHQRWEAHRAGQLSFLPPPVNQADALGWDHDDLAGFPRLNDRDDGDRYRARDMRPGSAPAFALTEKGRSWSRIRPARTVSTTHGGVAGKSEALGHVNLTEAEAAVLQTFPSDYPWQGSRTKRFQQIGNAVPPLLAQRLLECVAT